MKSDKALYTNAAKDKVLPEGHPEALYLLMPAGNEVPESDIEAFGAGKGLVAQAKVLIEGQAKEAKAAQEETAKEANKAPQAKAAEKPEDKAQARPENKSA